MKKGDIINDQYLIIEEIGEGGMGKVFKVELNDNYYALKICSETDGENIKRFKREVRLMSSIKHENVIEVIDSNLDADIPYFVMPLCKFSIDKRLDHLQANPEFAIEVLLNVCNGINAIHNSKIIHRDIKPKNILVSQDNKIKISDLGLSKFSERDSTIITSSNVFMGTQGFIPPEFFQTGGTKNADERSDIYQLGKTIYNIFTSRNPLSIQIDILPAGLLYVIQRCIANNPDDRYQSVGELQNALNNYLLSLKPQENPISAFENLLNIANENSKRNQFDKDNVEAIILTVLGFKEDPEFFFNKSNEIPKSVLDAVASNLPDLCADFIRIYSLTIERHFKENHISFSDAEYVANSMVRIFNGSNDLQIRIEAMKITLITSVWCNRYDAMGVFDDMLQAINNDQDAYAVSEMLNENIEYYKEIADRIPTTNLHHTIQTIQKKAQIIKEDEKAKALSELNEW